MKNINDFIKNLVKIEEMESGDYGFYPFQMFIENKKKEYALASLDGGGGGVHYYYMIVNREIIKQPERLYIALDFPPVDEVKKYFIAVFSYENKKINCILIPYDIKTGKVFDRVGEGKLIKKLLKDFSTAVNYRKNPVGSN